MGLSFQPRDPNRSSLVEPAFPSIQAQAEHLCRGLLDGSCLPCGMVE